MRGFFGRTLILRLQLRSVGMYGEFWNDEEGSALLGRDAMPSLLPGWRSDWLGGSFRYARHPVDRMLWLDSHTYLPGDLLVKMDIASTHCGLEVRSPLLDHEIIEFCATLPLALKVRAGVGKYVLKKLAERYFPRQFVHRRKMGFGIPLAEWLRGPLRDNAGDPVRSSRDGAAVPAEDSAGFDGVSRRPRGSQFKTMGPINAWQLAPERRAI
jgi:asparagine synthetase B (glutamine-hydrolysing)